MIFKRIFSLIIILLSIGIQQLYAEETDQFTLPPGELQDIGPTASQNLYDVIEKAVVQTNYEIQRLLSKSSHNRHTKSQLTLLQNGSYVVDLIYKNTGPGIPRWMRFHNIPKQSNPITYKEVLPWKTVYWLAFSQSPLSLISLAPTINMYGYYFGTDKLGHFFMIGHNYYKIYNYLLRHGKSSESAHAAMVTYGKFLEQSYLGVLVNGVYSNGDLAANYSGWKFYMNIAHSVKIGNHTLPPILVLKGNKWEFSKHVSRENLLKPYISDNLNEAWNPCRYTFTRNQIRKQVKKRCDSWISRNALSQQLVKEKLEETSTWHGENYGHWLPKSTAVTLEVCFNDKLGAVKLS